MLAHPQDRKSTRTQTIVWLIAGWMVLMGGIVALSAWRVYHPTYAPFYAALGLLTLAAGAALPTMRRWAWTFAVAMIAISITVRLLLTEPRLGFIIGSLVRVALDAAMLAYIVKHRGSFGPQGRPEADVPPA